MRRFIIAPRDIDGETVILSGAEAHHLRAVLRLRPGDRIELLDGTGTVYLSELTTITEDIVYGCIIDRRMEHAPSPFPLTLAQGILKGKKMDLVLQKATELGVETLTPLVTRYCEQQKNIDRRLQRWHRIMLEACKQCGRTTPMEITPAVALEDLASTSFAYRIFCWEGEKEAMIRPGWFNDPGKTLLLIGPEGGFHDQEVRWARENDFYPTTLGPLVLRAETAAITAIGITRYLIRLQADRFRE